MSGGENPYASPKMEATALSNRQVAIKRLFYPALGLIITGLLMLLMFAMVVLANVIMLMLDNREFVDSQLQILSAYWYVYLLMLLDSSIAVYGGIQMLRGRQYGACVAGSVGALIPFCLPCYVLGIPFGVWGLVVLLRKETKAAFGEEV